MKTWTNDQYMAEREAGIEARRRIADNARLKYRVAISNFRDRTPESAAEAIEALKIAVMVLDAAEESRRNFPVARRHWSPFMSQF